MTVYCTIFNREGIESDGAQSESKLAAEAKLQDEQVAQGEPVTPGSEKDTGWGICIVGLFIYFKNFWTQRVLPHLSFFPFLPPGRVGITLWLCLNYWWNFLIHTLISSKFKTHKLLVDIPGYQLQFGLEVDHFPSETSTCTCEVPNLVFPSMPKVFNFFFYL